MIVYDNYSFNTSREIDSNGYLRVSMSNISKTQVRPYLGREIPNYKDFALDPNKIYNVLCPEDELRKAAKTFNNLPLTREHIVVDVDDVPKEKIVGSLGDSAKVEDGYLKNNLIIYDKKDIDKVLSGARKELSCGYRYTPVKESGEFEGQHYDFKMTDIVGNHVALVKQGRAGRDVMVADSSKGLLETIKEKIMAVFDNDLTEDEKEPTSWITVHGAHIPLFEGENKETAVKKFFESKKDGKSENKGKQKKPEFYVSTENDGDGQYYTVKAKSDKKNGMDVPLKKFDTQKEAFEYKDEMDAKFSDKDEPSKEGASNSKSETHTFEKGNYKVEYGTNENGEAYYNLYENGKLDNQSAASSVEEAKKLAEKRIASYEEAGKEKEKMFKEIDERNKAKENAEPERNLEEYFRNGEFVDYKNDEYIVEEIDNENQSIKLSNKDGDNEFWVDADDLIELDEEEVLENVRNQYGSVEELSKHFKKIGVKKFDSDDNYIYGKINGIKYRWAYETDKEGAHRLENSNVISLSNGELAMDNAIPEKAGKPEEAREEKALKQGEEKMTEEVKEEVKTEKKVETAPVEDACTKDEDKKDKSEEKVAEDKDNLKGKEEKAFAEGVDYGEKKEKEEPKKLDSEHESEGEKKAEEKKEEKKEEMAKDSAMVMDADALRAEGREQAMADFKSRDAARKAVKSVVGDIDIFAFDSADDIYKFACKEAGLNCEEIASYKDAFTGLQAGKAKLAMDASPVSGSNEECLKDIRLG